MTAPNGPTPPEQDDERDDEPVGRVSRDERSSNRRNLSEISHLFLSDLRRLNGDGRAPPKRLPPGHRDLPADPRDAETIDLTPEEFDDPRVRGVPTPPAVAALVAADPRLAHQRAVDYAAALAHEQPVGLAFIEDGALRIACVAADAADQADPLELTDPAQLAAALDEAKTDIGRWLLVFPEPRLAHAGRLLTGLDDWTLLTTADHDGVVAGYRTLKALCDLDLPEGGPRITLALHGEEDAATARRHAAKLVGVCRQFLNLSLDLPADAPPPAAGTLRPAAAAACRDLIVARWPDADAAARGWDVVANAFANAFAAPLPADLTPDWSETMPPKPNDDFVQDVAPRGASATPAPFLPDSAIPPLARPVPAGARRDAAHDAAADAWVLSQRQLDEASKAAAELEDAARRLAERVRVPHLSRPADADLYGEATPPKPAPVAASVPAAAPLQAAAPAPAAVVSLPDRPASDCEEVFDLPSDGDIAGAVVARLGLAATPVNVPSSPATRLCVSREGALTLVAAAAPGLSDLGGIGRSLAWAADNRELLGMALSQYRLDATADVRLHLLVAGADASAEAIRPLLGSARVTVQRYRRLTWAGRSGVLLEAA